ncbi:hypothetical protein JCM10212_006940 [Sporobolomyces blumeae]
MRPSAADILAAQLEQASINPSHLQSRSNALSAPPPLSRSGSHASTSHSTSSAAPWDELGTLSPSGPSEGAGLGFGSQGGEPGRAGGGGKLRGRTAISKARAEDSEEATDEDLEDELNDFGYGSTRKRKEKKESLLDLLNSEPPSWMVEPEPVPVSIPKRSTTLQHRLRTRFSSNHVDDDTHAGFTTLNRGGSKSKKENENPLRSSKSASNLFGTLRSKMSGGGGSTRSRDDLTTIYQQSSSLSSSTGYKNSFNGSTMDDDAFDRLVGSPVTPTRKLKAKEAVSAPAGTRDLADFLRAGAAPPTLSNSKSSTSLANTEGSSVMTTGDSTHGRSTSSLEGTGGSSGGASIVKAAMVKLSAGAGRRASLSSSKSLQQLLGTSQRPATSGGFTRPSPPRKGGSSSTRPSTGRSVMSDDSVYDPMTQAIQVDDALVRGMFGSLVTSSQVNLNEDDAQLDEEAQETLRDREASSRSLGVYEFVAIDERESGGKSPEPHRLGSMVKSYSTGDVALSSNGGSLGRKGSSSSARPVSIVSPRRKPVPLVPDDEDPQLSSSSSSSSSSPARSRSFVSPGALSAIVQLQDRGDTSPLAVDESPIKGRQAPFVGRSSSPFSSLVPRHGPASPLTPSEMYQTPPMTPSTPLTAGSTRSRGTARPSTAPTTRSKAVSFGPTASNHPRSLSPILDITSHVEIPMTPPPERPRPEDDAMNRSGPNDSRRLDSFRPKSLVLQPACVALAPSPSSNETERSVRSGSTDADAPRSLDSSECSPAPRQDLPFVSRRDETISSALEALRTCLAETNSVLPPTFPSTDAVDPSRQIDTLVPTLRGLQLSLESGARLIGAVLRRIDEEQAKSTPSTQADGADEEDERALVEAMLG